MDKLKNRAALRIRRIKRVRAKVKGRASRPRLTVKRTLTHIYAQIVDDETGRTLAAASDLEIKEKKNKTETASLVGKLMAEKAKAKNVTQVVFDRRDKKYHGRIKALAEGARSGGLIF